MHEEWGFNSKVTELQAAFGLAQLDRVPKRLERFTMASIYHDKIQMPGKWNYAFTPRCKIIFLISASFLIPKW